MDTDRNMDVDVDMGRSRSDMKSMHEQFAVIIPHVDYCRRRFVEETFC
jgi:hypothetical protein